MRYVFLVSLFTVCVVSMIVWATRPELITNAGVEIKKPFTEWKDREESEKWKTARKLEYTRWTARQEHPTRCDNPKTSIIELECKNLRDEENAAFERIWENKIASGWKPEGVN